jgi:FkbM family methyltransferase
MLAANEHGIFCMPRKILYRPACQAILRGRTWEAETIKFLCDNASGDIIHAGTFFGDFLPALARAYAQVWAFEPNPDSFRCAQTTISLNGLRNVTIENAGLGRESAHLDMCIERKGRALGGASFIIERPGKTPIVAIDDAVPADRHVGMIHLDVEGYERAALEGARETIKRCKPIIVLETSVSVDGYAVRYRLNENTVLTPSD